jgi:beta-glucosidase-like glycosyl hydrolase
VAASEAVSGLDRSTLERWIGSVIAPEVRVAGTIASRDERVPSRAYLERFSPALVVAFGRTPSGAVSPTPQLERVRATCAEFGREPPLAAADLEQGAGLHFADATRLPPALGLAGSDAAALDWIRAAGELVGREARARGVELVLAPVADVNLERDNPIIGVRSFGDDAATAAERACAFLLGLHAGGAAGCAKHFPGHGNTRSDSHVELPLVARSRAQLEQVELAPFRRLIAHGVETVMVGHLDVPALTGDAGLPATLSPAVVERLLRDELGFCGPVLTDALDMGALRRCAPTSLRALQAGCDALLCPGDPWSTAVALLEAVERGALDPARLARAAERMDALRSALRARATPAPDPVAAAALARALCDRALTIGPAAWPELEPGALRVLPCIPSAETPEIARCEGELRRSLAGLDAALELLPVICEARAGRGRYGPTPDELAQLDQARRAARARGVAFAVLWMGSAQSIPSVLWSRSGPPLLAAVAPSPPLVAAAARWIRVRVRRG